MYPTKLGRKFKRMVVNNVNITTIMPFFFTPVKFIVLDRFRMETISITPDIKFNKPKIVLKAINIAAFPLFPRQLKVMQFVMNGFVRIFGMILSTRSKMIEITIKLTPMKKDNTFRLISLMIGRRIMNILSNPKVRIAIGRRSEVIFCRVILQNSNGVA